MARRLRVHPSTVSLALRDSRQVSERTRRQVQALARRWGYAPNSLARALRTQDSNQIGVIFPHATTPYFSELLDALYFEARDRGYHVHVRFHQWNPEEEKIALQTLIGQQVEKFILTSAAGTTGQILTRIFPGKFRLPVVMINVPVEEALSPLLRGYVGTDTRTGSRELGNYLVEMGHRRIAILLPEKPAGSRGPIGMRVAGLREAIGQSPDGRLHLVLLDDENRPDGGRQFVLQHGSTVATSLQICRRLVEKFLALDPLPTALVTTDEPSALVALGMLHAQGMRVPEDLSVACYGGSLFSEHGAIPLTLVEQPLREIARVALQMVWTPRAATAAEKPEVRLLPSRLVVRKSVAPPATEGRTAASVLDDQAPSLLSDPASGAATHLDIEPTDPRDATG